MNLRLLATPSGRLLVSGWISADEGWTVHTQIVALEPDGAIASGYGSGGSQVVVASSDAALDPKGRLLLLQAPREAGRQQVMRLRADGRLDRSFGKGGRIALRLPERGSAGSLAVDRRGRPLVAGTGVGGRLLIGRLRASGAADRRFGRHGWLRTGMGRRTTLVRPGETREYPGTVPSAALSGGRLVVADAGWSPRLRDGGVFLAGYELGR